MACLLIIAHAPLASALKAIAAHTFPDEAQQLRVLDVLPDMSPEALEAEARSLLPDELDDDPEVLVMTDVFGATPSNIAQRLVDGNRVRALAGVNVPMLWRSLCYCHESLDAVVTRAVAGATQGVMQVSISRPQNQTFKPGAHDPNQHHHQQ